jgi:hypothetical protein
MLGSAVTSPAYLSATRSAFQSRALPKVAGGGKALRRAHRRQNREQPMREQLSFIFQRVKRCTECGEVKPLTAFDRAPHRADGRETRCSRCKRAYERRYRATYPERKAARNAVELAIREGRLRRPDRCQDCGRACLPRAHHESYDRRHHLDVDWLCASCHYRRHAAERQAANQNSEQAA